MKRIAYLNGKFIPIEKANVSVLDRGFLYGDGAFETMRAYNGCVFLLEKHIDRLFAALKAFHIKLKADKQKMRDIAHELLKKNGLSVSGGKDAYIKIIVTRGKSRGLPVLLSDARPSVVIYALAYKPYPADFYKRGIKILISERGFNGKRGIAGHKSLNYLSNILASYEAKKKGFDDVVLINEKGFIGETSSSNIFLVKKKKLLTPGLLCGILPGITRREVMRISNKRLKQKVREDFLRTDSLYSADEIFLTNSLAEITPVVKVNTHRVGNGTPGPVTQKLMRLFKDSVQEYRRQEFQKRNQEDEK